MTGTAVRASGRQARGVLVAWLALLALMFSSLACAFLPLGPWNWAVGLGIAVLKAGIVAAQFMHLRHATVLVRAAAAAGAAALALLLSLTQVDYRTRSTEPAAVQVPQSIQPLIRKGTLP